MMRLPILSIIRRMWRIWRVRRDLRALELAVAAYVLADVRGDRASAQRFWGHTQVLIGRLKRR